MREKPKVSLGHIDIAEPANVNWDFDPDNLVVLPTRDFVMFPNVTFPIVLGRKSSLATATDAEKKQLTIGIFCQRDPEVEDPKLPDDIHRVGVLAHVIKVFELPDGNHTAILRSGDRVLALGPGITKLSVKAELFPDSVSPEDEKALSVTADMVRETALGIFKRVEGAPHELSVNLENFTDPVSVVNMVATHTPFPSEQKSHLLAASSPLLRAHLLLKALKEQDELLSIRESINEQTRMNLTEGQRQNFLQQQMETIRQELYGDSDDDVSQLRERADSVKLPEQVRSVFDRELQKLSRFNPQSPDYAVQFSYLDVLLSLPWGEFSETSKDFQKASEVLEKEHYGLVKVKERIIEQIAVMMNRPEGNNPILCLVGPPGVGKTSLGKSVAAAMGREYQRVSLGGLHDESEFAVTDAHT